MKMGSKLIYELNETELFSEIRRELKKYYSDKSYHEISFDYINIKELYSITDLKSKSSVFPIGKRGIERKSSGPYYNHIGRIVLRNLQRGIRGRLHLQGNELHDVIENSAKLGTNPKDMIKKMKHYIRQSLFEKDAFNCMLLLTRDIFLENGVYVENKDDPNYLKRICLPPKNEIELHGVSFNPENLFPLPLLMKGNDIEDNIDKVTRGLYKEHIPELKSIIGKFSEGHIISYFLEHLVQSPEKDRIVGYHPSYTLRNYNCDSIEKSSFELLKDLKSLEGILIEKGANPTNLISVSQDTAKKWLDD